MLWPAVHEPQQTFVRSVDRLDQCRRGFHDDAPKDDPQTCGDTRRQQQILNERSKRRFNRHDRAGESRHAQPEHREDGAPDRKIAALPRGARRAEKCERQGCECERIDRRHETIVQLGAELSSQIAIDRVVRSRPDQFPEIPFANPERDVAALLGEFRHIEGIAAERDQRRIVFAGFEAFEIAVLKHKIRSALVLKNGAVIGDDGDAFLRVAPVVDKNAGEHAARLTFADADGQVLVELGEAAGLQDVGEHIRGDLGIPMLDAAHPVRGEIGGGEGDQKRHHTGGVKERPEQPERRQAGRVHHDNLGVGGELVEGMRNRDHQRDRRDDQHQRRNDQAGDAQKSNDRLTLAGHEIDAAQRLRNPDHPGQADQNHRKRRQRRAENIPVDRPHRDRDPTPANRNCSSRPNPEFGILLKVAPP